MIFDYDLMFLDDKNGPLKSVSSGILGDSIDLSGAGQGKGYRGLIAIAFTADTTATGDPEIQFALETADNANFQNSITIPFPFKMPYKKADLKKGTVLTSTLPLMGLQRYVRLRIGTDSIITCISIRAGFVLDAPLM